ncbi:hypothetical protein ABB31_03250 [Stenotrophomonas pavanii]|nr:hypothetical protein ABB31_03250 [Stenotrophomonas pavanii]
MAWMPEAPALLLIFLCFRGWHSRQAVGGRTGWGCGGVSRMDAATKATWTYLRRPPAIPPRPTQPMTLALPAARGPAVGCICPPHDRNGATR